MTLEGPTQVLVVERDGSPRRLGARDFGLAATSTSRDQGARSVPEISAVRLARASSTEREALCETMCLAEQLRPALWVTGHVLAARGNGRGHASAIDSGAAAGLLEAWSGSSRPCPTRERLAKTFGLATSSPLR